MRGAIEQVLPSARESNVRIDMSPIEWHVSHKFQLINYISCMREKKTRLHHYVIHFDLALLDLLEWIDPLCVRIAHVYRVSNWDCVGG